MNLPIDIILYKHILVVATWSEAVSYRTNIGLKVYTHITDIVNLF